MSNLTLGQRAIGPRDGDTLTLSNQWAKVTITFQADESGPGYSAPAQYVVHGDLLEHRAQTKTFRTAGAAISYAMQSLAAYQDGRAD